MRIIIFLLAFFFNSISCAQNALPLSHQLLQAPVAGGQQVRNRDLLVNRLLTDSYNKWRKDPVMSTLLPGIWHERDSLVNNTSDDMEKAEITYYYANATLDLSHAISLKFPQISKRISDTVVSANAVPSAEMLAHSFSANLYLDGYMRHACRKLFSRVKEEGEEILEKEFDMPVDTLKQKAMKYGETFLSVLYAGKCLPAYACERYLADQAVDLAGNKDLIILQETRRVLQESFPGSIFLDPVDKEIEKLTSLLNANLENSEIIFLKDPESVKSLDTLIAPYKGKVIYLDIWGTWCGPCVMELQQYTKALKERFAGRKDLVFLYLAMENERDGEKWEQFIRLHEVTGYHLRKTDFGMEPFWKDLLHTTDVPRTYPTYAIIDRSGKAINTAAKRPSDGESLYLQLEEALNK